LLAPAHPEADLDAAICYSKIAPDVPHALHMRSHIFTRLGMWQQSIDSNRAAHAAAVAYIRKTLGPESFDTETVHTMDYLEYAYLQTAQDRGAKEVVGELTSFRQSAAPNLPTAYAVAAIPCSGEYPVAARFAPSPVRLNKGFRRVTPSAHYLVRALGAHRSYNGVAANRQLQERAGEMPPLRPLHRP
jgi:hypothetical protein